MPGFEEDLIHTCRHYLQRNVEICDSFCTAEKATLLMYLFARKQGESGKFTPAGECPWDMLTNTIRALHGDAFPLLVTVMPFLWATQCSPSAHLCRHLAIPWPHRNLVLNTTIR